MRIIKKAFCAALALLFTMSLASCHGSRKRELFEVPDSFDTTRNIEIVFWI